MWILEMNAESHSCVDENQLVGSLTYQKECKSYVKGHIPWIMADGTLVKVPIEDVLVTPKIKENIISLKVVMEKGFRVRFQENKCGIFHNNSLVLEGIREENRYRIDTQESNKETVITLRYTDENGEGEYRPRSSQDIGLMSTEPMKDLSLISTEPADWKSITRLDEEEQELWKGAMELEMESMARNGVLEEYIPKEKDKTIGSRWTYSVKYNDNGSVSKIKARLVAMGCHQREGIDYGETYAPVVTHTTIRALLTVVANRGLITKHCDITSAFLYGDLEERIIMRSPNDHNEKKKIYLLKKAIYGLKQAAHSWHNKIAESLNKIGYISSKTDTCLYRQIDNSDSFVLIHVDDLLLASQQRSEISRCVRELGKEYIIKDLGEARRYLGMCLEHDIDNKIIYLHQTPMINAVVNDYGMKDSRPTFTPMIHEFFKCQANSESDQLPDNILYQKAIGSLLYLGMISRPDIHLPVNILSRSTASPSYGDWEGVKRIMRYLNTTKGYKLQLGGKQELILKVYTDADWGGEIQTRRSTSGQLHFLGRGLIDWKSRKQNCVSLSTAEAEFIAAAEAAQTVCWIKELLKDLNIPDQNPFTLYTDNQSSMKMTESQKPTKRSKHVDVKYHFLKDLSVNNVIKMEYCPTNDMLADIMTKPLCRAQHHILANKLGLIKLGNPDE